MPVSPTTTSQLRGPVPEQSEPASRSFVRRMSAELAVIQRAGTDGGVAWRKTNHREPRHERPRMPAGPL
jgi:hypothetical protein